jgi:hypothetical protein
LRDNRHEVQKRLRRCIRPRTALSNGSSAKPLFTRVAMGFYINELTVTTARSTRIT